MGSWVASFVGGLKSLNEILAAGISITAFSLFLYALTFNLKDRVARSFALIMACVVTVFSADAIGSVMTQETSVEFWLRFQWIGILLLPPTYLHFSDALLATTGQPSRGKRRWAIRVTYLVSILLIVIVPFSGLLGPVVWENEPAPHLRHTIFTTLLTLYYVGAILLSWYNLIRAYRRTTTSTSRRRVLYLLAGATAPAIGSYPYLIYGSQVGAAFPVIFWLLVTFSNFMVGGLIVVMSYAVAFFGVPWPDRVIKSRLAKWLLRGPITAASVLAFTTLVRRFGATVSNPYPAWTPIVMVASILVIEYAISLAFPYIERWLFYGRDRADLEIVDTVRDRLLTENDLRQFLEMVLAAACDRLQSSSGFLAALGDTNLKFIVATGENKIIENDHASEELVRTVTSEDFTEELFSWDGYFLVPLRDHSEAASPSLLGLLGVRKPENHDLDEDQLIALDLLADRATLALRDRHIQQQVFSSLQALTPGVELIQRLRAAARYEGSSALMTTPSTPFEDVTQWVKGALTHYWGGPRLTESPLIRLKVVQRALEEHDGNAANALRSVLRQAIESVRPEGERRFTGEWILYNILDLKFLEGKMVREIALRLAMSEADLYRKQRVAIESVAKAVMEMEENTLQEVIQEK